MTHNVSIVIYEPTPDCKLQVKTDGETVWLSIDQMAELFGRDKSVVGKHVRNVFKEGELERNSVWANFAYTAADGKTAIVGTLLSARECSNCRSSVVRGGGITRKNCLHMNEMAASLCAPAAMVSQEGAAA